MEAMLGATSGLRITLCRRCRALARTSAHPQNLGLQNSDRIQRRFKSDNASEEKQARPLEGFYAELLDRPLPQIHPATQHPPTPPPASAPPKSDREQRIAKARIVFGSRLAGPAQRDAEIVAASTNIAGVLVPPRPGEPDNCCMSGCVNCVWDRYQEELEEWAARSKEAGRRMRERGRGDKGVVVATAGAEEGGDVRREVAASVDEDGGGREGGWRLGVEMGEEGGDLFADIPVGIREFMRTEKMLRERRKGHGVTAG